MSYVLIQHGGEGEDAIDDLLTRKVVGLDFETTGIDPRKDVPLLVGVDEYIFPCTELDWVYLLRKLATATTTVKVEYNASFEGMIFERYGIRQRRVVDPMLGDMLVHNGLTTPKGHFRLDSALWRYLYIEHDKQLQTSFVGADPATFVPTTAQLEYLYRDVASLPALATAVSLKVAEQGMTATWKLENQYSQALAMMQYHGALVDVEGYRQELEKVNAEFDAVEERVSETLTPYILEVRRRKYLSLKGPEDAWRVERDQLKADLEKTPVEDFATKQSRRDWINAQLASWKLDHPKPQQAMMNHQPILVTSNDQIFSALNELGIKVENTERETLILARPNYPDHSALLNDLGELSSLKKIRANEGTELLGRLYDGSRLTTRYNQLRARTGRISSNKWRDKARCMKCDATLVQANMETEDGEVKCPGCERTSSMRNFGKQWGANMQNLTARFKRHVRPGPGRKFVIYDYSQIELRVAAELILRENTAATDALVKAFRDGLDPHCLTGESVTGTPYAEFHRICCEVQDPEWVRLRRGMKVVNFGATFGFGPEAMAVKIYVDTKDDTPFGKAHVDAAAKRLTAFWGLNPTLAAIRDRVGASAIKDGFVETLGGRRRYFETRGLDRYQLKSIERQAISTRIQGTAADIAKEAQNLIYDAIADVDPDAWLWAAVHDEIALECDEEYADDWELLMAELMDRAFKKHIRHIESGLKPGKAIHSTWTH